MFYSKKLLKEIDIKHCFFNRIGGKSKGIYKSLNCGKGSLDNKQYVRKNLIIAGKKVSKSYKNLVSFELEDKTTYHFTPFFYGRPGKRKIQYNKDGKSIIKIIDEKNSFHALFKQETSVWVKSQEKRNQLIRKKRAKKVRKNTGGN